jgi:hypothetical protein
VDQVGGQPERIGSTRVIATMLGVWLLFRMTHVYDIKKKNAA